MYYKLSEGSAVVKNEANVSIDFEQGTFTAAFYASSFIQFYNNK